MSSCEKCWADSYDGYDQSARYTLLLKTRHGTCTPEEQAGPSASECPVCHRMTLHQWTDEPMCGCPRKDLASSR